MTQRSVTTRPMAIAGRRIPAGQRRSAKPAEAKPASSDGVPEGSHGGGETQKGIMPDAPSTSPKTNEHGEESP